MKTLLNTIIVLSCVGIPVGIFLIIRKAKKAPKLTEELRAGESRH